ncbi:hypothetical protein QO259_17160 [Salinicola sp. JS01]|uniref:hypothetical protein n=1 Tax=Salinicola sp. JS01 TaxID=3050071 RepID=UPI00255BBDCA|nr:hypothetical protein [Salinicola sp. JS01]WIX32517.1 hypothetical protein QO259_17160 [Salinicola sp. JS01]
MQRFDNLASARPLPVYRSDNGNLYRYAIAAMNHGGEILIDFNIEYLDQAEAVAELINRQGYADGSELEKVASK